jgi:putative flippase GtrA
MSIAKFASFASIGAAAYFVDAGVLAAVMHFGTGPYLGRGISWLCAATFTWYLNRIRTFRDTGGREAAGTQWLRFLAANSVGGVINLSVYGVAILASSTVRNWPWVGVALGSAVGLVANFFLSKRYVFEKS